MIPGRSENAVKNRYNILYKKYRGDISYTDNVSEALTTAAKEKSENNDWIKEVILEKKAKLLKIEETSEYKPTITILRSSCKAVGEEAAIPKGRSSSSKDFPIADMESVPKKIVGFPEEVKNKTEPADYKGSSIDKSSSHEYADGTSAFGTSAVPPPAIPIVTPQFPINYEIFINPKTNQELMVSDQGTFVREGMSKFHFLLNMFRLGMVSEL